MASGTACGEEHASKKRKVRWEPEPEPVPASSSSSNCSTTMDNHQEPTRMSEAELRSICPTVPDWDSDAQHEFDCDCSVCVDFYQEDARRMSIMLIAS